MIDVIVIHTESDNSMSSMQGWFSSQSKAGKLSTKADLWSPEWLDYYVTKVSVSVITALQYAGSR